VELVIWLNIALIKMLYRKARCLNAKSIFPAKYLVPHCESATANIQKFEDGMLGSFFVIDEKIPNG
jgi:hypothetical protein